LDDVAVVGEFEEFLMEHRRLAGVRGVLNARKAT
jgi:hypothetical protein